LPLIQLLPPLSEYSHLAPSSSPVTLSVALLVMRSLAELPVSAARASPGAAAAVSIVKAAKLVLAALVLPGRIGLAHPHLAGAVAAIRQHKAAAAARDPAAAAVERVLPAGTLFQTRHQDRAVVGDPIRWPSCPLSAARARPGAAATVSIVKAAKLVLAALVLPARSVWRTCTWPAL
jgi:hypothetical protein